MDNINRKSTKVDPRTGVELPINPRADRGEQIQRAPRLAAATPSNRSGTSYGEELTDGTMYTDDARSARSGVSRSSRASSRGSSRSRGSTPDMRHEDVEKLVRVMREFEENETLLMREGDRILDALAQAGADERAIMALTHGPLPDTEDDLNDAETALNDFLIHNVDGQYIGAPGDERGELDMDDHLQRLHRFINEQHRYG